MTESDPRLGTPVGEAMAARWMMASAATLQVGAAAMMKLTAPRAFNKPAHRKIEA